MQGATLTYMYNNDTSYRLRIAPSPTGYPHIGTMYQALFNYAYAKRYGGSFIVRIEDTDRTRFVADAEDVIFKSLDWFGLTEDESPRKGGDVGPYRQSERLALYHQYAQELVDKGFAYFSYYPSNQAGKKKDYTAEKQSGGIGETSVSSPTDAPKTVAEMLEKKDWILRMKIVVQSETVLVHDQIRGDISFPVEQITEQVLLKSDGYPTYHLAVVVDDHLMRISHILRAEEWISSLPKHVLLYQYFGWQMPPVYHTATLRNPDKSKLSKRHGHTNVNWFREEGYLPEAVLNFLALLGWSHPEEKELFSLKEFIDTFDLKDIRPVAPIFDLKKLNWLNGEYIRMMSADTLEEALLTFFPDLSETFSEKMRRELIILSQTRMETLKDFQLLTNHFTHFTVSSVSDEQRQIALQLARACEQIAEWDKEHIFAVLKEVMIEKKIKMPVLYTLLTGQPKGLPLPESLVILGKQETLSRLGAYA